MNFGAMAGELRPGGTQTSIPADEKDMETIRRRSGSRHPAPRHMVAYALDRGSSTTDTSHDAAPAELLEIRRWASVHNVTLVAEVLSTDPSDDQINAALKAVSTHNAEGLVVRKHSRLGRDAVSLQDNVAYLRRLDAGIYTTDETHPNRL